VRFFFEMYPHRIRLRGPWECEPLLWLSDKAEQPLPPPCRIRMPCRWDEGGLAGFVGRARFRRSFGYPGRIDVHERVWLTLSGIGIAAEVRLNNHLLGRRSTACEFEVTSLLLPRNELVMEIEGPAEQGGWWGDVALMIRCTAFLRNLHYSAILKEDRLELRVSGQLVGWAERPLELYLLLDRSVVGYQTAVATAEGQPFEFLVPDLPAGKGRYQALPVQLDLVNGAVVWFSHPLLVSVLQGGTATGSDQGK
jgi:hypothetical protein